jgi:HAD superfamily hydrolase (TIGR02253 family)
MLFVTLSIGMFKAVLFDLDNTLIDFVAMKNNACDTAIRAMIDAGLQLDSQEAHKILFNLYDKYGIEYQLIFNAFLKKVLGRVDYRILANAIVAYRKARVSSTVPYPQTRTVLLELKSRGLKLGIVTDAPRLNAWLRLAEMGLTEFFDVVITLGDSKKSKPSPNGFKKALRELDVDAKSVLFVGDNPGRDILGAKKVGMKTCLAKYGQTFFDSKQKADFEIEKISELRGILLGK